MFQLIGTLPKSPVARVSIPELKVSIPELKSCSTEQDFNSKVRWVVRVGKPSGF